MNFVDRDRMDKTSLSNAEIELLKSYYYYAVNGEVNLERIRVYLEEGILSRHRIEGLCPDSAFSKGSCLEVTDGYRSVIDSLRKQDIKDSSWMLLKGGALGRFYTEAANRQAYDIDLIVRDLETFVLIADQLRCCGYSRLDNVNLEKSSSLRFWHDKMEAGFELHVKTFTLHTKSKYELNWSQLFSGSYMSISGGRDVRVTSDTDTLIIHLLSMLSRSHFLIRDMADLLVLVDSTNFGGILPTIVELFGDLECVSEMESLINDLSNVTIGWYHNHDLLESFLNMLRRSPRLV